MHSPNATHKIQFLTFTVASASSEGATLSVASRSSSRTGLLGFMRGKVKERVKADGERVAFVRNCFAKASTRSGEDGDASDADSRRECRFNGGGLWRGRFGVSEELKPSLATSRVPIPADSSGPASSIVGKWEEGDTAG